MSLVELILAILLLNVVILTGISMELGMRRIFSSTDTETQLLDETAPIVALIAKDINRGIGDATNPPASYAYDTTCLASGGDPLFCIHVDSNNNGVSDAGDIKVAYRFHPATNELWYYRNSAGGYEILSGKVTAFSITAQPANGTAAISITLVKNPAQGVSYTNPQLTTTSSAQFGEFSLN